MGCPFLVAGEHFVVMSHFRPRDVQEIKYSILSQGDLFLHRTLRERRKAISFLLLNQNPFLFTLAMKAQPSTLGPPPHPKPFWWTVKKCYVGHFKMNSKVIDRMIFEIK